MKTTQHYQLNNQTLKVSLGTKIDRKVDQVYYLYKYLIWNNNIIQFSFPYFTF